MKKIVTSGIVLMRINYQEADRILTIITPDQGKVRLIAKGVRKEKSKLAGGVELLSENEISFIRGKGEIGTLVSSRLKNHHPHIVKDLDRTMYAYEFLKAINKITEDNAEAEHFHLTNMLLAELGNKDTALNLIKLWADVQLLQINGHAPELVLDISGAKLQAEHNYDFDYDNSAFSKRTDGLFNSSHIKLLRLARGNNPAKIATVSGIQTVIDPTQRLTETIRKTQLNV